MENCIFCKISNKEIPCSKIFEDENFISFLDIKPVSDGHLLIIPKKHIVWMQEAEDEIVSGIFKIAKKLMLALKKGLGCDYVQVSVVGNEVPHFHVHLIPRHYGDNFINFPTKEFDREKNDEILKKITGAI
jgi:histidine triad (HIT) family protein